MGAGRQQGWEVEVGRHEVPSAGEAEGPAYPELPCGGGGCQPAAGLGRATSALTGRAKGFAEQSEIWLQDA